MSNHDYVIRQGSIQINSLAGQQNVLLTVDANGLVVASGLTSGSFITSSQLAPITAALQSQITEQGDINSIQSVQIAGITATYTPLSTTAAISAYFQGQIDNLPIGSVIADITATQVLQSTQIQSITGRLTDVELVNGLQSSAIASLSAADASLTARVSDIEVVNSLQSAALQAISGDDAAIQSQINSITGRLSDVESVNDSQSVAIASLSAADVVINSRLSDVEVVNSLQSSDIASLSAADVVITGRLSDVETVNGLQSVAIASLSATDVVITGRLTDVEAVNTLQSSDIASLSAAIAVIVIPSLSGYATLAEVASLTGQLDVRLTEVEAVNDLQSSQIVSITADYTTLTQTANLTGNLQSQISGVTQSLTGYYTKTESDGLFVHLTGDEVIAGKKTFSDDIIMLGSLTVAGSATFLNSTEVLIKDNFITLNSNVTAGAPVLDAGIQVSRGNQPNAELRWNETTDVWEIGTTGSVSEILTVENAGSALDSRFVNITGDTMSGTLYITGADLAVIGGQISVDSAVIKYSENTEVDTGTEVVDSFPSTLGNSAVWTVSVRNGINIRTSQVIACWVGSSVEYTEVSTLDLGLTSGLTLIVDNNVGSNGLIRLQATALSNGWVVKALRNVL